MKLIKQGTVCLLLGALPILAFAAESAQTAASEGSFTTLDADHSGALSRDELKSYPDLTKNFDTVDANTDGKISPVEFTVLVQKSQTPE